LASQTGGLFSLLPTTAEGLVSFLFEDSQMVALNLQSFS